MTTDPMHQFEREQRLNNITTALRLTEDPADRAKLWELLAQETRARMSENDAEART